MKPRHVAAMVVFLVGCNATSAQLKQTANDSFKLAGCIAALIFGGITDAGAIAGQCVGALPAVIVDVVNDIEAKSLPAAGAALSPEAEHRLHLLEQAKASAVAKLAEQASSK